MRQWIRSTCAVVALVVVASVLTCHPAQAAVVFSENFDGVSAPSLPAGWTVSSSGTLTAFPWVTSTTSPSSAPNDAFTPDPNNIGTNKLTTPSILIPLGFNQLVFHNSYNLEDTFDGGVLEISINGGAFQDILAAGGSFATGGYNKTISVSFGSPIAGRQAWSGNSNGYITTTVNLPSGASGEPIQLTWFLGTDNSVSAIGWRIDDVVVESVPEPSTLFLLGLALPAVAVARRRTLRALGR